MKAVLLFCAAVLACGFMIDTPESRQAAARLDKRWKKEAKAKFDFPALHEFLRRTVAEKREFEEVDLKAGRLNSKWEFAGTLLKSGDWTFSFRSGEEEFEFTYTYAVEKFVALKCARLKKNSFRLIEVYKGEWITLSP